MRNSMSTWKKLLALIVGLGLYGACVSSAEAQVRIYKVTFNAKARVSPKAAPKGFSFKHTGYVIYAPISIGGPAAQTVEVFKNKTFRRNGPMLDTVTPGIVGLAPIDRDGNGVIDHEFAFAGANGMARSYLGKIPRNGFRFNVITFLQTAKSVAGRGSVLAADHFTVTDKWTMDKLSGAGPANTAAGVGLVKAFLEGKNYTDVTPP